MISSREDRGLRRKGTPSSKITVQTDLIVGSDIQSQCIFVMTGLCLG